MSLPQGHFTQLHGIENIFDSTFDEQIEENLISFFDWGLLSIGAFFNVRRPSASSKFNPVNVPGIPDGTTWESVNSNFVWESGVPYPNQPIQPSGIYLNNTFIPNGSGYHINYEYGQIIFDSPKPVNSTVFMDYSYRKYNFYSSDSPWFHRVIFDPMPASGLTEILAENRVYLPAVIVEVVSDANMTPYQLGDLSTTENQTVLFHIIAEESQDRDKMVYILKRQYQKTIWFYDVNAVGDANAFPVDENGSVVPGALTYPDFIQRFAWKKCIFANIRPQEGTPELPFYRSVVKSTLQVIQP